MINKLIIKTSELIEVWDEVDNNLTMIAYFDNENLWGIIVIENGLSGWTSYRSDGVKAKNWRKLVIIDTPDYRNVITKAQQLWQENYEKWVEGDGFDD